MDHLRNADTPLAVVQPRPVAFPSVFEAAAWVQMHFLHTYMTLFCHSVFSAADEDVYLSWEPPCFLRSLFLVCPPAVVGIQVFVGRRQARIISVVTPTPPLNSVGVSLGP